MQKTSKLTLSETISDLRSHIAAYRKAGKRIGFVPTMGALHEGHLSLIRIAKENSDVVVVSIFVNPTQFGPNEDFETYPRQLETDLRQCRDMDVDLVFAPGAAEMYDEHRYLSISIDQLNNHLCGASRPGFFEGVLLVVNKLFNLVQPDVAVFGQKDYQQYQIIRQMAREFHHPVEVLAAPIVRANDGLALSSRNAYLSSEERALAPGLYRSLQYIERQIRSGVTEPRLLIEHQKDELQAKGFKIDYLNLFHRELLKPATVLEEGENYILAGAVIIGETRLIDNVLIDL
ncbi:MAG: pantoate--beta-alanine ligase [Balneolaceae bacterium]